MSANSDILTSEEDANCKICYDTNQDPSNPLITPCLCAGSIRHVHHDCLVHWIKTAGLLRCELCKHPFAMDSKAKPFSKWDMVELTYFDRIALMIPIIFCIIYWGMIVFVICPWAMETSLSARESIKLFFGIMTASWVGMFALDLVLYKLYTSEEETLIYTIYLKFKIYNSFVTVLEAPKSKPNTIPRGTLAKEKVT